MLVQEDDFKSAFRNKYQISIKDKKKNNFFQHHIGTLHMAKSQKNHIRH